MIRGIGLIGCYVNVKTGQFWVIDYQYDPDGDGKTS